MSDDAKSIVQKLSLEQKTKMVTGRDFWHFEGIPDMNLPSIAVSDGSNGLRKQVTGTDYMGMEESLLAVCYPNNTTTANSFDVSLLEEIGSSLGKEAQKMDVAILLGPAVNIKRDPMGGRNYEYFSEDPYLTGKLGAAMVRGIQNEGVGACIKHMACNNREDARMISDSVVDERALREIYLKPFEMIVKESSPSSIMMAYNKINGTYFAQNYHVQTEILRNEWGYQGLTMPDWGAVSDPVESFKNGLDIEMPGTLKGADKLAADAVAKGELSEERLDEMIEHQVSCILEYLQNHKTGAGFDTDAGLALAQKAAEESAVLLKNHGALPLQKTQSVAIIGEMAKVPRYQGGGSTKVNPVELDTPWEAMKAVGIAAEYAAGYQKSTMDIQEELLAEAAEKAKRTDVAVVFAGIPELAETEGSDKKTLALPEVMDQLIAKVAEANPNTVVVLQCGSPVLMPWIDKVNAVLLMGLTGCQGGNATVNLLWGQKNPCGKLAESFPISEENRACAHIFKEHPYATEYRESIFVGYRYYDSADKEVLFPFGHGLSYTDFLYSEFWCDREQIGCSEKLRVCCKITNTGRVKGKEVVQLYISPEEGEVFRPRKELKGFCKIELEPGESKVAVFEVDYQDFQYYDIPAQCWMVEEGAYGILIGGSSRDIRLLKKVTVKGNGKKSDVNYQMLAPEYYHLKEKDELNISDQNFEALLGKKLSYERPTDPFTQDTTLGEVRMTEAGRKFADAIIQQTIQGMQGEEGISRQEDAVQIARNMIRDIPLRNMRINGTMNREQISEIIDRLNKGEM